MPDIRPARSTAWRPVALLMFGVGWGANQFASLLAFYTERLDLGGGSAQAMFGIYAVALVPGLALGGPASDRYGRRRLALPFASVSVLVTLVLMAGATAPWLLYTGRFLAGIVTGAVLASGTAWVKELSPASGTRLTALAVSAGFGAGPLTSALIAQWAPNPLVTAYLPHLLIMLVGVPLAFRVPETRPRAIRPETAVVPGGGPSAPPAGAPVPDGGGARTAAGTMTAPSGPAPVLSVPDRPRRGTGVRDPAFRRRIAPVAVWAFAAPVTAFTVLPVEAPVGHLRIAYTGLMTAITLGAGMAAQPVARRLDARRTRLVAQAGLGSVTAGMLVAALTVALGQPLLNTVAAILLGAGYGFILTYSLGEVARIARPGELAGLTAVAYALIYVGMFTPLVLTALNHLVPMVALLLCLAALCGLSALYVTLVSRRAGV
ncbi:MFS transporter [Actinomadura xylanilytica]|uniref:MFS transporter n=1 Tax=Actinomadura xylanilytica TaxID=887459 RepID=UPI00255B0D2B|nr:MFS transporter [Actinomadura xylanilytica]MDL4774031.1 MFS transporter [Actinomadura xylanilytica]